MKPLIGAHVSAAGGLDKLLARADDLGVEAVQLHPSAPQSYRGPNFSDEQLEQWRHEVGERQWPIFFHGIYLINLASEDERLWHASISSVVSYLNWAPRLSAVGSILHVGSHKGRGFDAISEHLKAAAKKIAADLEPGAGKLIIENTAGGGGTLGRDIAELKLMYDIFSEQLPTAICLDTCHLFASGVDLRDAAVRESWFQEFDQQIGLEHLAAIHLNDSVFDLDSKRDRHANLGEGMIGEDALAAVVTDARLAPVPFLLEVPGAGAGPDQENIARAQGWRK